MKRTAGVNTKQLFVIFQRNVNLVTKVGRNQIQNKDSSIYWLYDQEVCLLLQSVPGIVTNIPWHVNIGHKPIFATPNPKNVAHFKSNQNWPKP